MRQRRGEVDVAMPDEVTRERLKKQVLDRWENEGGRIVADPPAANEGRSKSDREGELERPSASLGNLGLFVEAGRKGT
ncbi:MAG TPA: hypothetical protein VFS10_15365 [Pyrinomonadaceae bacterium]|nr:hypothetical protein [Pyrinomonadaceae bacterium]